MIEAEFFKRGESFALSICGHAEHGGGNGDIVCAAVSGMFYALLGYAANECDALKMNEISPGLADIECSCDGEEAMKLTYIGFVQISAAFPESLSVREDVWGFGIGQVKHLASLDAK